MASVIVPRRRVWSRQPTYEVAQDDSTGVAFAANLLTRRYAGTLPRQWRSGMVFAEAASGTAQGMGSPFRLGQPPALTCLAVWMPCAGQQWLSADGTRTFASTRPEANTGWSWGRESATAGGSDGNVTRQRFVLLGVAAYSQSTYTIPSFRPTVAAMIWTGNGGSVSFFDDGGYRGGMTLRHTVSTGSILAGGELCLFGLGPSGSTTHWLGAAAMFAAWPRALSQSELGGVADNPWQLFRPRRTLVPMSSGAATFPALSLPGVTDVTSTSARPRVTVTW